MIEYGIFVPKYIDDTIYKKDIVIMVFEDNILIAASVYDYSGKQIPISYKDLVYEENEKVHKNEIEENKAFSELYTHGMSPIWLFKNEPSAILQKIIMLESIYLKRELDNEIANSYFYDKIPENISDIKDIFKNKFPETKL